MARPFDVFDCHRADYVPVFTTRVRWVAHLVAWVLTKLTGRFFDFDNLGPDAQPDWLGEGEVIANRWYF